MHVAVRFARLAAAAFALVALALPARAQFDDGGVPDYVAVKAYLDRDAYHPGETARIIVEFKIDPRVHVNSATPTEDYQFPTSLTWGDAAGIVFSDVTWPKAAMKAFEFTEGKKIAVYEGTQRASLTAKIPAGAAAGARTLEGAFKAQGCTHTTCYAPQTDDFKLVLRVVAAAEPTAAVNEEKFGSAAPAAAPAESPATPAGTAAEPADGSTAAVPSAGETIPAGEPPTAAAAEGEDPSTGSDDQAASTALPGDSGPTKMVPAPIEADLEGQCPTTKAEELPQDRSLAVVFLLAFVAGIGLAFTPCVLPLVPITIGFFARQRQDGKRPVIPALAYVLGLAIVYSVMGTIAALSGGLFGSMLQKPAVIIGIAALLFALALSMFGLWDLNLPSSITNRIGGGRSGLVGAMMMGGAMGLVAAPCVGPFVVSLLTYVADLGSRMPSSQAAFVGGSLFFVLAVGLGLPFFVVALGAGSLRPGEWMVSVKKVFGCIILGVVLWFLRPLVGADVFKWGIVLLLFASGLYFLAHSRAAHHGPRARVAIAGVGVLSLVGFLTWTGLVLRDMGAGSGYAHGFATYSDDVVARAKADGRPVVIDFSAEWCIACKELEHQTFPDRRVQDRLKDFVALRADLSEDNATTQAIYKQWGIRGLPTIVFLDSEGNEIRPLRLTGFEEPDVFVQRLDCVTLVDIAAK